MKGKERLFYFAIGLIALGIIVSSISNILLPFIVGMLVAYFLDPVVDKIETFGFSRFFSTLVVTILFFVVVISGTLLLLPVLYDQFISLAGSVPKYVSMAEAKYGTLIDDFINKINIGDAESAKNITKDFSAYILKFTGALIGNIWHSGVAALNLLSLIFISPIVSFYLLYDWDNIIKKIDDCIPRDKVKVVRKQAGLIDAALSGYIRGQSNVCLLLGIFYAAGLSFLGLDFGLFIGLGTGILAFIPYVGLFIGMTIGLIVAFFQFGDLYNIGAVLAVFVVGQIIEGNFVTPKLVGNRVGLHPAWIIFALLAGGSLFGFIGILLAVPVAATIGVIVRFSLSEYMKSTAYKGISPKRKTRKKKA